MLHYAVASPLRVHGDSSWDGAERSLDRPENNVAWASSLCSFAPSSGVFQASTVPPGCVQRSGLKPWAESCSPSGGINHPKIDLSKAGIK